MEEHQLSETVIKANDSSSVGIINLSTQFFELPAYFYTLVNQILPGF